MVASAGGTALALTLTLALALVLPVGGAAAQPWVQRQPKTLVPRAHERIGFAELVELHARKLGAWDRLALVAGAEPIEPSVYLTLLPDRVLVWDDEVLPLARGVPAPAELASCPPLCLPHLRDALSRALFAEAARVRAAGARTPPRILLLADSRLPYRTFLAAAYSAAHASVGGPPDLRLAVRTGSGGSKLGQIGFFLAPTHSVRVAENADPLLLQIAIEDSRYVVRARRSWLPAAESARTPSAVATLIGELKARDTTKTVVFVSAAGAAPLGRVLELVAPVRALFPGITLGGLPRIVGPRE